MAVLRWRDVQVVPLFENSFFSKDILKDIDFNFCKILPLPFPLYIGYGRLDFTMHFT